jgi:hypothetical protein
MVVNGGFEFFSTVILLNGAHALIPWVFPKPIHRFRSNTIQSEEQQNKMESILNLNQDTKPTTCFVFG